MVRASRILLWISLMALSWPAAAQQDFGSFGHVLGGAANAPVQINVFSDFQCSACREFYLGTIKLVLRDYAAGNKVRVVYHEIPLQGHKYSRDAARYAGAAARMGTKQLLAVMDALFLNQSQWAQNGRMETWVAKALSLQDFQTLKRILREPAVDLAIDRELKFSTIKGLRSTPTMFLRYAGKQQKAEGLVTYPVLKQFLDAIVK